MSVPYSRMSDSDLLNWSDPFSSHLTATPTDYHISADQAAAYATLNTAFATALSAWGDPSTRTPVALANKTAARDSLLAMAKYLVNSINSNPATTDTQRNELNIKARKSPSPIPAPTVCPIIHMLSVSGRTVTIELHAPEMSSRSRPAGAQGASVFSFVGAVAPTDPAAWKFQGLITKTRFELSFTDSTTANTVWVTANWYNERGQTGPGCSPVSVNLPAAPVLPMGESLKIAA